MSEIPEPVSPAKVYSPRDVETRWYAHWESSGYFHADVDPSRAPFTIVIPPPNVTGVLHMGHVLNLTLQDIFIRYKRMTGFEACWIPGMDHAGIATQHVVERSLAQEGKTRHDLGRDRFVERVWEWKKLYGGAIIRQLRLLGCSCDWGREKFTLDETLSNAVREVFVRLFEEGLIYRGKYIVNWCPRDHTAISDDEVNHAEQQGKLYFVKYPRSRAPGEFLTVATTRPETMFGDVAIAVNPGDTRFTSLIGTSVLLPLVGREIPVIADAFVDPDFGTGMVKVTPAHDPNDYWIGQRHDLPQVIIFDNSAKLNDAVPAAYRGMDRFDARTVIVADLESAGLLEKVTDHVNTIGRCYRCDSVIEPYLSDQWFVKMKPLADPAREAVRDGTIRFYPDRWTKVYDNWMVNIRDWCISRQLWWGHRIPVWYCSSATKPECAQPIVSRATPEHCPHCGGTALRQDEDVLDTWFSSWLWPFSVHDWPQQAANGKAKDLAYFYPTDTLVTAPDIIFFWVARMIMAGLKFGPTFTGSTELRKNIPFSSVYFTSTVRDEKGRKMSKSLGNSPDPLELITEYGADAVRFTIVYLAPLGVDVLYAREKNELGRNFANKIWNAGRFLLLNKDQSGAAPETENINIDHLDLADRWILSRLNSTIDAIRNAFADHEMTVVAKTIFGFFWHDYCDWYVEMIKSRLYGGESAAVKQSVIRRALDVYDRALRLLHPIMPFITEELWQMIRVRGTTETIMRSAISEPDRSLIDGNVERQMSFVQNVIEAIRTIRGEMSIPPSKEIALQMKTGLIHPPETIRRYEGYLERLARVTSLSFLDQEKRPNLAAMAVVDGAELFVPLEGLVDIGLERARLQKEIDRINTMLSGIRAKLGNARFVEKAPPDVVTKEQEKQASFESSLEKLSQSLARLSGGA